VVFTYLYYRGPLLGVDLAVARECEPPSVDVCLPCDACILGGFSGCFSGFFLVGFGLFRPGAARAPILKSREKGPSNNYIICKYSKEVEFLLYILYKSYR
jgi:hypothetical protein